MNLRGDDFFLNFAHKASSERNENEISSTLRKKQHIPETLFFLMLNLTYFVYEIKQTDFSNTLCLMQLDIKSHIFYIFFSIISRKFIH